jgi:hypothetical protein
LYAFAIRDARWNVDEAEAMVPAKPLKNMIARASRRVPMIGAAVKIAGEPATFATGMGRIIARRIDNPVAPPVYVTPEPAAEVYTNGQASVDEIDRQRRRLERKRAVPDVP